MEEIPASKARKRRPREQKITIFYRNGKFYWTTKSKSFSTFDEAASDADRFSSKNTRLYLSPFSVVVSNASGDTERRTVKWNQTQ